MKLRPTIKIEAEITINDREAEVIELLCSYDLADWFASKCNRSLSAEEIKKALSEIRRQAALIQEAKKKVMEEIFGAKQ